MIHRVESDDLVWFWAQNPNTRPCEMCGASIIVHLWMDFDDQTAVAVDCSNAYRLVAPGRSPKEES